jgi:hypothetical protein
MLLLLIGWPLFAGIPASPVFAIMGALAPFCSLPFPANNAQQFPAN